ncbi:DUF6702 family protein [Lewinella sp. IMCC34191]|uniref:DUF6702 family protein n=1 Tax=Lewinella sp. IMCC34191 TaxID=2259172 RepID=UPI000E2614E0|nr:DUF6702 family protein [Lewinella sp. IMCC34191]
MLLLLSLLLLFAPPVHDYHVSKTNVRYVADRNQLQIEMQVFVDDIEEAMEEAGAPRLRLGTPKEHAEAERFLTAYLDKHFRIDWNGERLPVEMIGYELEDDMHGLWIYLAANDVADPEGITVENSVLTEYYADQKNIVKLYDGERRVATMLMDRNKPSSAETF